MAGETLSVALISDVFFEDDAQERLTARLKEAKRQGADLAVIPELGMNPWSAAGKEPFESDAEGPGGPRHEIMAAACRESGVGLVGAVIMKDPETSVRRNTAVIFDADGHVVGTYAKCHLPEEPGFWETSHYEPADELVKVFDSFGLRFGVQICSDLNRPQGSHLLGAGGAEAILNPRATEQATYERWRPVFVANALTSCCYVLSVNRPSPELGVLIGGPSIAVSPMGAVLAETTEPVVVVTLDRRAVESARQAYPGYLKIRADLYSREWGRLAEK